MAERYLFFNSTVNDPRTYQAQDFADYFGSVLSTGLLHTDEVPGMNVTVEQGTLNTMVGPGKAIMKGHLYENTAPLQLTHSLPEPTVDRIDRIVLRLDLRHMYRNILLRVKEGMPAATPEPPELQRDEFIYEISLARIRVRANTVQLFQEDLIDERLDEELCGLVHSLISIPIDQFEDMLQQMQDEWDDWFSQQQTEGFVLQSEKGQPGGVAKQDDFAAHSAETVQDGVHGMGSIAAQEYEEGTWTPTLESTGTNSPHTYNAREGQYVRLGNQVTVYLHLAIGVRSGSATGEAVITGLPFSTNIEVVGMAGGSLQNYSNIVFHSDMEQITLGTITGGLGLFNVGDNRTRALLTINQNIQSGTVIRGSITYKISS